MSNKEIFKKLDDISIINSKAMNLIDEINRLVEQGYSVDNDEEDIEDIEEYEECYSPSNPWDAPGMRVSDFI